LPEQVRGDAAHLAVCVDGDGEACRVLDERGQPAPAERLLLLLAKGLLQSPLCGTAAPGCDRGIAQPGAAVLHAPATIVLEESTTQFVHRRIEQFGGRVVVAGGRRAETAAAMRECKAVFGGGPAGRFWHLIAGMPLPDGLMTITQLLILLSRSDEPFSAVLDRQVPLG
jgi:phosphomannomutase